MPPLLILGHRGSRNAAFQQNSYSAFREALDHADGLETDASRSRDGIVYLIHDTTFLDHATYTLEEHLDRPSAERVAGRRLDQMESGEIDLLRLRNGEPISRLDRLLTMTRLFPDAMLNIELKGDDCAGAVIAALRTAIERGDVTCGQIIISSFNFPALAVVRRNAPEFAIGALFSVEDDPGNVLYPWSANTESRYTAFGRSALESPQMRAIRPDFVNIPVETLSIANVGMVREVYPAAQGMVWPWIERTPETDQTLAKLLPLTDNGFLHAWITDEPRLQKAAMLEAL